jgi:hypothetical protein
MSEDPTDIIAPDEDDYLDDDDYYQPPTVPPAEAEPELPDPLGQEALIKMIASGVPGMPDAEAMAKLTGGYSGIPVTTPDGSQGLAVPQTAREVSLYQRFMAYDKDVRSRLVLLEQRLGHARDSLKGPLFSGRPDELDDDLLSLFDEI